MKTYFKTDAAYLILTTSIEDKIFVLTENDTYLLPVKVTPLRFIIDALTEQFPGAVFDFNFEHALADEHKSSVFLGSCATSTRKQETFPSLLRNKSSGRLVLFKAFQYRMGSHLESLRVVETNEIPKN